MSGVGPLQLSVDGGPPRNFGGKTRITVGRTPGNDVVIDHPLVSRQHLAFVSGPRGWLAQDLRSTNGIFTGGSRHPEIPVNGPTQIMLGDPATGPRLQVWSAAPAGGGSPRPPVVPRQVAPGPVAPGPVAPGPAPGRPQPAMGPIGGAGPVTPPPRFQELPAAPHLQALRHNVSAVFQLPGTGAPKRETISLSGVQTIGRTPDNDIVVADVLASRRHARLISSPGAAPVIEDLGSINGTFVNGARVHRQNVTDGDVVTIGNSDFVVSGGNLVRGQAQAQVADGLHVHAVSLVVDGGKQLLKEVEFSAKPGSLTAVIGPSGAGKSTVSKIAAGLNSPTSGLVTFEGRSVHQEYEALRTRIGMVPQQDVLHHNLTLRQALRYAAELRLPPDSSQTDRDRVIDGVLSELQLTDHVDTRISKLSGGQQKRASVAMELLTGPSLLILDEPTSGLDPALDRQVMQTLRRLADAGRVVLVVTHSLTYMSLCDQVLLLAPGGKTAYCGPPGQVEQAMGTGDWAEIFAFVADQPDTAHMRYLNSGRLNRVPPPPPRPVGPPAPVAHTSLTRQASTVARRQLRLIFADTGYLIFLVALPVVLGLLTMVIPGDHGFKQAAAGELSTPGTEASQILVVLVVGAAFMGAALTVRDLVGERAIFERERAVGLRPGAYLGAKIVVFFIAAILQSAIMVAIAFAGSGLPELGGPGLPPPLALFLAIAVLSCVSTLVGLVISASVKSNEQVMPPLVIVIMVQLVFCGGLFKLDSPGLEQLSWIFPSFWGYVAAAGAIDLNQLNPVAPPPQSIELWNTSYGHTALAYAVMILIGAALAALTYSKLRLKRN